MIRCVGRSFRVSDKKNQNVKARNKIRSQGRIQRLRTPRNQQRRGLKRLALRNDNHCHGATWRLCARDTFQPPFIDEDQVRSVLGGEFPCAAISLQGKHHFYFDVADVGVGQKVRALEEAPPGLVSFPGTVKPGCLNQAGIPMADHRIRHRSSVLL